MTAAPSKGDQARREILDAARHLFVTQGYAGTSMRIIARQAGDRAVAGLYNHFANKEAIFQALIEEHNPYDDLLAALESALAGVDTAPQFIRTALHTIMRVMPQHIDFLQLSLIDMRVFDGANLRHVLEGDVFPRIFALMSRMQAMPGLAPIEQLVWMRVLGSMVIGYMITEQIAPFTMFGEYDHDAWADHFSAVLLYGLLDPDQREEHHQS